MSPRKLPSAHLRLIINEQERVRAFVSGGIFDVVVVITNASWQ